MFGERIEEILRRVRWRGYVNQRNTPLPSLADDVALILTAIAEVAEEGMRVIPLEYSCLDGLHCAGISDEKIVTALKAQRQSDIKWLGGVRQ